MPLLVLFSVGLFLAYSNGANDNLKGAATLLGSRTASERGALVWGTLTTLLGSLCAIMLSGRLLQAFSGRGVVPDALIGDPLFLLSTGGAAGLVVMVATVRGLPVSTTHALVGGLAGAGVASAGALGINWSHLFAAFALPLLLSPVAAAALVLLAYPLLHRLRRRSGIDHETCLCIGTQVVAVQPATAGNNTAELSTITVLTAQAGRPAMCVERYRGRLLGVAAQTVLDALHWLSAGAVGFARGLNDTPKIAAILLAGGLVRPGWAMASVGVGMAVGAVLHAMRVGRTMGFEITPMNSGQGFTANLATSALVIGASRWGLPVSTTHVSVGALSGLGASTGGLVRRTLGRILLAWVATLPAAFLVAALIHELMA